MKVNIIVEWALFDFYVCIYIYIYINKDLSLHVDIRYDIMGFEREELNFVGYIVKHNQ